MAAACPQARRGRNTPTESTKMNNQDNPFGGFGGQYSQSVNFGETEESRPTPSFSLDASQPPADVIKDTTTQGFAADVIQESRNQPVLVDFWAPWCGPCKQLTPVLEKAVLAKGGRVKLVKMNIDDHPAVAGQLGIQSIPAVIAFKNGQPVDGFMGAVPESQINAFLDKLAGKGGGAQPQIDEALAAAAEAREAGDMQTAADIYQAILEQLPDTVPAIAAFADLLVEAGDIAAAKEVLATAPEDAGKDAAIAAVQTKIELAEEAAELGDTGELERRVAENPKDYQARFDLALLQNAAGKRDDAADSLLAIVKADRSWNEDGARAQLLKFFEAWGPMDDATLAARRKLSSLLFS